jgi:hypothetical protein
MIPRPIPPPILDHIADPSNAMYVEVTTSVIKSSSTERLGRVMCGEAGRYSVYPIAVVYAFIEGTGKDSLE